MQQFPGQQVRPNYYKTVIEYVRKSVEYFYCKNQLKFNFLAFYSISKLVKYKHFLSVQFKEQRQEIQLLQNIADSLPSRFQPTLIVSGNTQIADKSSKQIVNLKQGLSQISKENVKSIIIGNSTVGQLQEVYKLFEDNKTDLKILVNSEWCLDPPTGWEEFSESFLPIYVFRPLEVKGLLGQKMGFMFKFGIEQNSSYRFYLSDDSDGSLNQIGQQNTRPSQSDIETVMYNANAAQSPINKGLSWMQSKLGKK
eukprot:TRINITY_DN11079_c0_g1_i1.p2 TRINITY_DN11079_c0_g1~~TRINITY_DN11079_c0_g1_i1.p2  ORF type:complete len:253 (+),score=17.23 TRINITY_DN11079_c0_g1_i1:426-1184(+)